MKLQNKFSIFQISLFIFFVSILFTLSINAQVPDVGPLKCAWCGALENEPHKPGCPYYSASTSNAPMIPSKSPEQIRQERLEKDALEARDYAWDNGVEYYQKGDFKKAVETFKEALEYDSDNPDLIENMRRAEEALNRQTAINKQKELKDNSDITFKKTVPEAISNLKNTEEAIRNGNPEDMKYKSSLSIDTKGDYRGSIAPVKLKGYPPSKVKEANDYLMKNNKKYRERQSLIIENHKEINRLKQSYDKCSAIIQDFMKKYPDGKAPPQEFKKYTNAVEEQKTTNGQLLNVMSTEKSFKADNEKDIQNFIMFAKKEVPGSGKGNK